MELAPDKEKERAPVPVGVDQSWRMIRKATSSPPWSWSTLPQGLTAGTIPGGPTATGTPLQEWRLRSSGTGSQTKGFLINSMSASLFLVFFFSFGWADMEVPSESFCRRLRTHLFSLFFHRPDHQSTRFPFQPHGINSIIISGKCGWKRKRKSCTTAGKTWTTFCRWFVQDLQPVDPGFFSCAFLSDSKSLDWRELTISSLFSCARANQWSWNSRSGSPVIIFLSSMGYLLVFS